MADFILLMHDDTTTPVDEAGWDAYFGRLNRTGAFRGGSEICKGVAVRMHGTPGPLASHITGFIRVEAADIDQARLLVEGNPVFAAGGTVEIRELPQSE
ncbi:MAG: hypothetical protein EBS42_03605 [Caulobacteraceae bacterium]|nr:hypothetical protein [Caulobacteraceae bacterium]